MDEKYKGDSLRRRIREGRVNQKDVTRRLAELAFGNANDCVQLVLEQQPKLDKLDLSLLSEIRRSDKGAVEIKLINRLEALEQLSLLTGESGEELENFLKALRGDGQE